MFSNAFPQPIRTALLRRLSLALTISSVLSLIYFHIGRLLAGLDASLLQSIAVLLGNTLIFACLFSTLPLSPKAQISQSKHARSFLTIVFIWWLTVSTFFSFKNISEEGLLAALSKVSIIFIAVAAGVTVCKKHLQLSSELHLNPIPVSLWHSLKAILVSELSPSAVAAVKLSAIVCSSIVLLRLLFRIDGLGAVSFVSCWQLLMTFFTSVLTVKTTGRLLDLVLLFPLDFALLSANFSSKDVASKSSSEALLVAALKQGLDISPQPYSWDMAVVDDLQARRADSPETWLEAVLVQRQFAERLLLEVKPSRAAGVPWLPVLRDCPSSDTLTRLLAVQDLSRLSRSALAGRRMSLFAPGGEWSAIAFICCGLLDAVTLQLQLGVAYALEEVLTPLLDQQAGASKLNKLSASGFKAFPHGWRDDDHTRWTALDVIRGNKALREEYLQKNPVLASLASVKASLGRGQPPEVLIDPFSKAFTQSVTLAIDGLTGGLVAALDEDKKGFSTNFAATAISSLLALSRAVDDHIDVVRRYCLIRPYRRGRVVSSFPKDHLLDSSVPRNVISLFVSVDEGLCRLLRAYHNHLPGYSFPPTYSAMLEKRLQKQ